MSSLLNKAKDAMGKSGGSSSTGGSGAGQQSGMEKGISGQAHTRMFSPPLISSITHYLASSLTSLPTRDRQPHRQGRHGRQVRRQDQQARRRPDQQPGPRRCWQQVNHTGRNDDETGRDGVSSRSYVATTLYLHTYLPTCQVVLM
jgi:hypothetical protein